MDCIFIHAFLKGSLSEVILNCYPQLPSPENFLAILNYSLYLNPFLLETLYLSPWNPYFIETNCFRVPINCISCVVRKDPGIVCQNLERSKSLSDLTMVGLEGSISRWHQSCPDLSNIQSLHPKLRPKLKLALDSNDSSRASSSLFD